MRAKDMAWILIMSSRCSALALFWLLVIEGRHHISDLRSDEITR